MTYSTNTPNATDLISSTQAPIKTNFVQADTQFGIDHTNFNNGGVNGNGFHKQVTLAAPVAAAPAGTVGIHHSVNGANFFTGVPIAFFANSAGDFPLMPDLLTSGTNFGFKLANIIFNYGSGTTGGSPGTATINFAIPFTTATSYSLSTLPTNAVSLTEGQWCYSHGGTGATAVVRRGSSQSGAIGFNYIAIGT
jgi:hypothetical protein